MESLRNLLFSAGAEDRYELAYALAAIRRRIHYLGQQIQHLETVAQNLEQIISGDADGFNFVPVATNVVLKAREQMVLQGIVDGLSNREIAIGMGRSEACVKAILQGLFHKAGVRTRVQLVRLAHEGFLGNLRANQESHEGDRDLQVTLAPRCEDVEK